MVEWEFTHGVIIGDPSTTKVLQVSVRGSDGTHVKSIPLSTLGLAGWELITIVVFRDEFLAFFKREKLYAIDLSATQRAMLDE
jgi:hypothetical protein